MFVYGVGDHGGGPTRRDIESAKEMQGRKLSPIFFFSTADQYFERVRPKAAGLHVQKGELGYILKAATPHRHDQAGQPRPGKRPAGGRGARLGRPEPGPGLAQGYA